VTWDWLKSAECIPHRSVLVRSMIKPKLSTPSTNMPGLNLHSSGTESLNVESRGVLRGRNLAGKGMTAPLRGQCSQRGGGSFGPPLDFLFPRFIAGFSLYCGLNFRCFLWNIMYKTLHIIFGLHFYNKVNCFIFKFYFLKFLKTCLNNGHLKFG